MGEQARIHDALVHRIQADVASSRAKLPQGAFGVFGLPRVLDLDQLSELRDMAHHARVFIQASSLENALAQPLLTQCGGERFDDHVHLLRGHHAREGERQTAASQFFCHREIPLTIAKAIHEIGL